MSVFVDVVGREINVGDRIAVAFSAGRSSRGWQRVGLVEMLEPHFLVYWEIENKVSPPLSYSRSRIVKLSP